MHVYGPIDGFGLNRSVGGFHLEISLARHADFNVQVPRIMAKREAPMSRDARRQLYLVAVLAGVDAEVLSQFVALVFDAKFHLSRVAGGDPYATIIGFHTHIRASRHNKRLGDVFRSSRR